MEEGSIFHILNRGVEKRKVFLDERDYLRFFHDTIDFNSTENATLSYFKRCKKRSEVRPPTKQVLPTKSLVDILCWCLMPNHVHLMVMEKGEYNAGLFSRKVFGGYTMYFNEKNERNGVLFQGRTKKVLVERQEHLLYLPFYIHSNPLDLFQKNWREEGIRNIRKAIVFLENYKWSNYGSVIGGNEQFLLELLDTNEKGYQKDFEGWLRSRKYNGFNEKLVGGATSDQKI